MYLLIYMFTFFEDKMDVKVTIKLNIYRGTQVDKYIHVHTITTCSMYVHRQLVNMYIHVLGVHCFYWFMLLVEEDILYAVSLNKNQCEMNSCVKSYQTSDWFSILCRHFIFSKWPSFCLLYSVEDHDLFLIVFRRKYIHSTVHSICTHI